MKSNLTDHEEKLAIELYLSNNADVDVIVAELWELKEKYSKARKMAQMGSVAEKFEICRETMSSILKRHGIPRCECPDRVVIAKKYAAK